MAAVRDERFAARLLSTLPRDPVDRACSRASFERTQFGPSSLAALAVEVRKDQCLVLSHDRTPVLAFSPDAHASCPKSSACPKSSILKSLWPARRLHIRRRGNSLMSKSTQTPWIRNRVTARPGELWCSRLGMRDVSGSISGVFSRPRFMSTAITALDTRLRRSTRYQSG